MSPLYKTPSWGHIGLSGQVQSTSGTVRATVDGSPADGSYGAILGFIEAEQMKALDSATEVEFQQLVLKNYVRYFGPEATNVEEGVLVRWNNEEFSRGGPTALAGPHTFRPHRAALKESFGGIHQAGTEASDY